jgi:two-component system LytT family response regulator
METSQKLVLNTTDSIHFVPFEEILYCKSNNSYTTFYLTNKKNIVVSRNIKEFETELHDFRFFRTHQSYLVNLMHILRIDKTDGFSLILTDNSRIPTSVRKKKNLLQILQNYEQFQTQS